MGMSEKYYEVGSIVIPIISIVFSVMCVMSAVGLTEYEGVKAWEQLYHITIVFGVILLGFIAIGWVITKGKVNEE